MLGCPAPSAGNGSFIVGAGNAGLVVVFRWKSVPLLLCCGGKSVMKYFITDGGRPQASSSDEN